MATMHRPRHTPTDAYLTATSLIQRETEEVLLTHLQLLAHASNPAPLNLPNTAPLNLTVSSAPSLSNPTLNLPKTKPAPILNKGAHLRYASATSSRDSRRDTLARTRASRG